jgi:hypothetical protein
MNAEGRNSDDSSAHVFRRGNGSALCDESNEIQSGGGGEEDIEKFSLRLGMNILSRWKSSTVTAPF